MSDKKAYKFNRRNFLKFAGVAGLATGAGVMLPKDALVTRSEARSKGKQMSYDVHPGQLDDYYGFWSGGHSGNISQCWIPAPAVIHWVSPRPNRAVAPSESAWSMRPWRT